MPSPTSVPLHTSTDTKDPAPLDLAEKNSAPAEDGLPPTGGKSTSPMPTSSVPGSDPNHAPLTSSARTSGSNPDRESKEPAHARTTPTDASLTPKQKTKMAKAEAKEYQRQSKFLKEEAQSEKQALATAVRELAGLKKVNDTAVKNEAKANAKHIKVLREFQKHESAYLAARTKFEAAQARLHSEDEAVAIIGKNAKEASDMLQEKSKEVDNMRESYTNDEKGRAIKLSELAAKGAGDSSGCLIC